MNLKVRNKIGFRHIGTFMFFFVMFAVVIWQIFVGRTETEVAVKITVNDSFKTSGWFFRNETVVEGARGDTVKHIVQGGDKVQKDAPLAVVYSNKRTLENGQKIAMFDDQIELLRNATQTITSKSDLFKIEGMITSKISEISSGVQEGVVLNTKANVKELRNLCLRKGINSAGADVIRQQSDELEAERNYLQNQIGNASVSISSPAAGFFSEVVDGFETVLTIDQLQYMTVDDVEKLDQNKIKLQEKESLGKIVEDFRWYFAMVVSQSNLKNVYVGDKISIRFSQMNKDIPVRIEDIRKQKNSEKALLIVSGMEITSEILSFRYQTVDVIKETYTGIKVPKRAVRVRTNRSGKSVKGVYILPDSMSRFKTIDVLYEIDDYYVVKQGTTSTNTGLVVGDRIIVKGKDLEDLKVIK